jgi:hypothetical protein
MEAEEYANATFTATMNAEAYTLVSGILVAHREEHPEDGTLIDTIKFERVQ